MRVLATSLALVLASTVAANAESFTFTGTSQNTNQVGGPVAGGKPVGATFSTGDNQATWASGKKTSSKSRCAVWSAPPASMFTSTGICEVDEGGNKFSVAFSCQAMDPKNTIADCWGRLTGVSGSYQNKTGTASWRGVQSADGKTANISGSGAWN